MSFFSKLLLIFFITFFIACNNPQIDEPINEQKKEVPIKETDSKLDEVIKILSEKTDRCMHSKLIILESILQLNKSAQIKICEFKFAKDWIWIELNYYDEIYPLTIDFLISTKKNPKKIIYLTAGGPSFKSAFFTPTDNNISHFLSKNGYIVVGISSREVNVPIGSNYNIMSDWGIIKHREDIRSIVKIIKRCTSLPYDMLGFSSAGDYILDYAACYSDTLDKIIILGLESYDPDTEKDEIAKCDMIYDATIQLMNEGIYADDGLTQYKMIIDMSKKYPKEDSGESRETLGLPGNFTFEGLVYFTGIYAGTLPGFHSHITGLPGEFWMQSQISGYYNFDIDPANDDYGFYYSDFNTAYDGVMSLGSGLVPLAVWRDNTAINSYNGKYNLSWKNINEKVLWINAEYGFGEYFKAVKLIKKGGNKNVTALIVPGYGHSDLIWSKTADFDLWPLILK